MTTDDIIELAKQAGMTITNSFADEMFIAVLTRFATIVRAQALEEAAGACDPEPSLPNEAYTVHNNKVTMRRCAAAIRALKDKP